MEISKNSLKKNSSDRSLHKKKYSSRLPENTSSDHKNPTGRGKESLSVSLSNSLKKLSHPNFSIKNNLVSLNSPKAAIVSLPQSLHSTRVSKSHSNNSLLNPSLRNYISAHPMHTSIDGKLQMSSRMALNYFKLDLTDYERGEILDYHDVYFIGKISNKLKPDIGAINYGFDDERGDYLLVAGDHIAYRYEIIKMLGKGNFGQVVLCEDHKRKEKAAVKLVRNKKRFNKQATVEIKVLQTLRENDIEGKRHVVKIKNYFVFRKHICMTFDVLSMNLYELLYHNNFEGFTMSLIHKFISQLLVCLSFAFQFKVIHCDLKPENIMLANADKAEINVIDFGSSCFEPEKLYTYIQSRFYRAPEIILGIPYTPAIDMWSLGCIIVEFFKGFPMLTGESEHDQLWCMMEVIGLPPEKVLNMSTRKKLFFEKDGTPKAAKTKKGVKRVVDSKSLEGLLTGAPSEMVDLVTKCLDWDPETRIKPHEALSHAWITDLKQQPKTKHRGKLKKHSLV